MKHIKKIINHYNELIDLNGYSKAGIGWKSNMLNNRYKIFKKYIKFHNSSILDFGGGMAHLFNYLNKEKIRYKNYIYYDLNKKLENFVRKKYKNKIKIINKFPKNSYDVIIINGVYNFNYGNNKTIFKKDIIKLFKLTKNYLGISFLNNNVDYKEKHLFYHNEIEIFKFCRSLTYKLIIDKNFSKYETFIILQK